MSLMQLSVVLVDLVLLEYSEVFMGRKEPNYNKLCVYDTETTGISPNYIISLAYREVENNKIVDKGMIICNPDYPIS